MKTSSRKVRFERGSSTPNGRPLQLPGGGAPTQQRWRFCRKVIRARRSSVKTPQKPLLSTPLVPHVGRSDLRVLQKVSSRFKGHRRSREERTLIIATHKFMIERRRRVAERLRDETIEHGLEGSRERRHVAFERSRDACCPRTGHPPPTDPRAFSCKGPGRGQLLPSSTTRWIRRTTCMGRRACSPTSRSSS